MVSDVEKISNSLSYYIDKDSSNPSEEILEISSKTNVSPDILKMYEYLHILPDGRLCGVHRLLFHWTVHIDIDNYGYNDRYCFELVDDAIKALKEWTGLGDLPGSWHRHPSTGRRRDPVTGKEWVAD